MAQQPPNDVRRRASEEQQQRQQQSEAKQPSVIEVQEFLEALIGVVDEYEHCMTRSQQAELLGMITSSVFAEARTSEPGFSEDMPFPAFAAHIINKNTRVRELSDVRGGGR